MTTSEEFLLPVVEAVPTADWWASGEGSSKLHHGRGPSGSWSAASCRSQSDPVILSARAPVKKTSHVAPLALSLATIFVVIGSVSPWATLTSLAVNSNVTGTDAKITSANEFVSGQITLIAGLALLLLGGLIIFFRKPLWTSAASLLALGTCGYSVFSLIHVYHAVHRAQRFLGLTTSGHPSGGHLAVGYGLIMVVVASGAAAVAALAHSKAA